MRILAATRAGIEQAVGAVRLMLALLAAMTVVAIGMVGEGLVEPLLVALAIGVGSAALTVAVARLGSERALERFAHSQSWLQALETISYVGLVCALETYVTDAAWILLVVPIVVASVRMHDIAVLGTWILGSGTYALAGRFGLAPDAGDADLVLQRAGVLLTVAASVALLTRWLQEGWLAQGELTSAAMVRTDRLASIEQAGRAMRAVGHDEVIELCIAHIPNLGFTAATARRRDGKRIVAGDGDIVPDDAVCDEPEPDTVVVTRWVGAGGLIVHSASVQEPVSRNVVSGWFVGEIDDAQARALHDLVENATAALEAAHHLRRARFEASHDPLTGLANRAAFRRQLDAAAEKPEPLALLFIDLDHFKSINDEHGHLIGDHVLVAIASRLERAVGRHGLVARFGGDEFVILATGEVVAHASRLGEHVRWALGHPFGIKNLVLDVTASVGVAVGRGPVDPGRLIQRADQAAYAAKSSGRNRVEADAEDAGSDDGRDDGGDGVDHDGLSSAPSGASAAAD